MKFLSQINVNTEYTLPMVDGTNGQVLSTDGSGVAYWGTISAGSFSLDGLSDVIITSPATGQILRYGIPVGSEDLNPVWHNWTPNFVTTANAVTITGTQTITGSKTFTAATTMSIASGSDVALTITKGGNGEGLIVNKTSGSGNAVTITGTLQATTIVKTGGTASQFLKADGSVDTNTYLTAHPSIANGGSVNNSLGTVVQDITVDANGHVTAIGSVNLDTRYYTQDDIAALFGGDTAIAGYNLIDWDAAYADKINSASFSTATGVLTLTQQDTGTITVDLDGRYLESLPSHTHTIANVTGLQTALDGKLSTEADTLQSVTSRGSSTNTDMSIGGTGGDRGLAIYHGDYGRIRFYQGSTNISTIHSFATDWQSGNVLVSGGALNLTGNTGVTIGGWNVPDAVFRIGGSTYFRNNVGIGVEDATSKLQVSGNIDATGVISQTFWTNDSIRKLNAGASLNFRTSAGPVEMVLDGSGNFIVGGISPNAANGAKIFGLKSESGKYFTQNAFGQDGGYTWPSTTYVTGNNNSPVGNVTFRGNGAFQGHIGPEFVPIDATKTYKVSVWIRSVSGSPYCYLSHRQYYFDYSNGNPTNGGWGNPYWWTGTPSSSWTEHSMTIGPAGSGAEYTHMAGVKFIRHGWLHNYTADGTATAEFQGWKIEELDSTLANNVTVLGNAYANSSFRAPIFYDSQDTSYYLDPNSTSNILASYIGRVLINHDGTDTWFRMQSGNRMRITTTGGTDFIIPNTGEMSYNGNTVIHTGNIGSYALTSLPSHNHDDRYYTETESDSKFYLATNPNGYITGISFANVSSKPTTIAGYGITDAITTANIGSQSVATSTQTYRVIVEDTRSGQRIPNDYDDYRASWEFTNQIPGLSGSTWWSLMTVQGWHDAYSAWQIIGPSDAGPENWYLRVGNNTTWGTARRIWHAGDFSSTNVTNWNTAYGWGNHTSAGYLTAEADTLATVTARGASTSTVVNFGAAGSAVNLTGLGSNITFKDQDNIWTGYVGFSGNTGQLSFPGRNVEIVSGYNGTITLNTGVSGYNSGRIHIPQGYLSVDNNYVAATAFHGQSIKVGTAGSTPTVDYGIFHHSGIGLGIASGAGGSTQGISFWSHNGSSFFESVKIAGSTGNMGVGTTLPDNKLTVKGDNALVDVQSTADGQTVGFLARYLNSATLGGAFRYTTGDAQLYIDNLFIGNDGLYSDINIRNCDTGGNLRNRIKIKGSSGYVGINNTAPSTQLHVGGVITATGGDSTNWNTAYNDRISSAAVTGTTTKTLTLTQGDGGTITATWTDYDTDNDAQQLTYDSGANQLSISGGNAITLTGLATEDFVTSQGYVTSAHTHTIANVTGLQTALDSKQDSSTAINTGNIASQSVSVARQLLSPNDATVVAADSAMPSAGHSFIHTLALGPSGNDGHILGMSWAGTTSVYGAQIFLDTDPNDIMAIRSRSSTGVWTSWKTIIHSGTIGSQSVNYANSAGTAGSATNLYGAAGSYIKMSTSGTSYQYNYQVRENDGGYNNTNEIYAPQLAFHWSGVVASSIMMEASGRIAIRNNPGTGYENFIASVIYSSGYGDSTQWNTAYGWGNHASAGYITASYLDDYTRGAYRVISDYGSNTTWYIRSNGQFVFGTGHDWTASFRLNIDNGSGYASNGSWAYFGQQDSNATNGTWRGVRIRKFAGGSAVDGDLSAGAYYIGATRKDTNWDAAYSWGNHADAPYWNVSLNQNVQVESQQVTFAGDVVIQGTLTESSSIRFKENITPLDPALDKVNQLEAVSYNKIGVDDREIGLIAEDVAELFPEVVTYNEEGQPQGIQYQRLSVILLKAVQELSQEVNELKKKLN